MPKKGKLKRRRSVNPDGVIVKGVKINSQSTPASPRKNLITGFSSTLSELRTEKRTNSHHAAISDVKQSLTLGAILLALMILIWFILRVMHFSISG